MTFIKSEDFFKVIMEKGLRKSCAEHENLREFLQINAQNPQLILLKNIRKTLEQMSENEAFMDAIQDDILNQEQKDKEKEALERIERGEELESQDGNT